MIYLEKISDHFKEMVKINILTEDNQQKLDKLCHLPLTNDICGPEIICDITLILDL